MRYIFQFRLKTLSFARSIITYSFSDFSEIPQVVKPQNLQSLAKAEEKQNFPQKLITGAPEQLKNLLTEQRYRYLRKLFSKIIKIFKSPLSQMLPSCPRSSPARHKINNAEQRAE